MELIMSLMMTLMTLYNIKEQTAMKMINTILLSMCIMMMLLWIKTGKTWMPMILLMLFLGGILIMFSIVSAIIPNQKKKLKKMKMKSVMMMMILMLTAASLMNFNYNYMNSSSEGIKSFLQEKNNMLIMMTTILMYFYSFIYMLSKEKTSMRTWNFCYKLN